MKVRIETQYEYEKDCEKNTRPSQKAGFDFEVVARNRWWDNFYDFAPGEETASNNSQNWF